ncbi:hypothetical protein CBR_g42055 [Chara braunii]|uniref:EGF-like domain-containing protein n=1 Tax=Chara braunii TaxID=69332 RepID=A0A388LWR6_CHABU|nr:hypothetical protein CBR_g42055 [Chara braunii]|eukprot:GBG86770.1 hypothetical protein CBR_g42055 [Chara braunii]
MFSESAPGVREYEPNGIAEGSAFYCFRDFKRCRSGIKQCIRPKQECDGVEDCEDGSDEGQFCKSFDCEGTGRYTCPSGKMCMNSTGIYGHWIYVDSGPYTTYLCNGVADCADGSDEDESFCASYDCNRDVAHKKLPMPLNWWEPSGRRVRCAGGKGGCVYERQLCDSEVDCAFDGGSDESDEFCKQHGCSSAGLTNLFQCRTGRCIKRQQMCDGKQDCPDGDDEGEFCEKINCPFGRVKCEGGSNRTCIEESQVCDGVRDCPGGTDEDDCATKTCKWGTKCPSGTQCAFFILCNGIEDCNDGSDEDPAFCRRFNCTADGHVIKCKNGFQCISPSQVCDGRPDCADWSDENPAYCRRHNCSDSGEEGIPSISCPGLEYVWCLDLGFLCDSILRDNCYLDTHLDPTFCTSKKARDMLEKIHKITCTSDPANAIYGHYCDGWAECDDGSDEREEFCQQYECPKDRVKCYGKRCVLGARCDGKWDCPDGSDEKEC